MLTEPTTGINWEEFAKQFKTIKGGTTAPSTPSVTGGTFDIPKLQTDMETNRTQLKSAEDALKGYQTKRYDEEYSKAELGTIKSKVAKIDGDIAKEKSVRDVSVSKVRRNPYYSAATITGEVDEIARAASAKINNLIDQRNSSAEQYNATLGEVTKKIAMETASKEREVEDLRYNLNWMTNQLTTYQTIRSQELSSAKTQERWEMDFATKLAAIEESRGKWETEQERLRKEAEEAGKRWKAEEERKWYTAKKETGAGAGAGGRVSKAKDDIGSYIQRRIEEGEGWATIESELREQEIPTYTGSPADKLLNTYFASEEEGTGIPTTENFVSMLQPFKDAGYSRNDTEKQFRSENEMAEDEELPDVIQEAFDKVFGEKKKWWQGLGEWVKGWGK